MTFVLTVDLDWASEYAIDRLLGFAREHTIRPTVFVTHCSPAVERAAARGEVELGIHPNFLAGSSHGVSIDEVLDRVLDLVPRPVASRCHAFVDSTPIALALAARGLRVDSNLCLHLQPGISPLAHWAGITRLPVFFADDVHARLGAGWRIADIAGPLFAPGLKVLLVHPFWHALDLASYSRYLELKPLMRQLDSADVARERRATRGGASLLAELIDAVYARGYRFVTLSEAAAGAVE